MDKTELDFQTSGKTLRQLVDLYKQGSKEMYRPISVELRKLLCDKNALLPRARPDFQLHKLHWTEILEDTPSLAEGLVSIMPGRLSVNESGQPSFQLLFARSKTLMPITEWVKQPFFNINLTVWGLIKSIADKEGAHSDIKYDDNLLSAKQIQYVDEESHMPGVVAIADYLLKWGQDSNIWTQ